MYCRLFRAETRNLSRFVLSSSFGFTYFARSWLCCGTLEKKLVQIWDEKSRFLERLNLTIQNISKTIGHDKKAERLIFTIEKVLKN